MPSPDTSGKVAVIGGGWAGMAAAVELASHDVPVVVFEAARTLGGRARRVVHDGVALDGPRRDRAPSSAPAAGSSAKTSASGWRSSCKGARRGGWPSSFQADKLLSEAGESFYTKLEALTDLNKCICYIFGIGPTTPVDPANVLFAGRRLVVGRLNDRDGQRAIAEEARRLGAIFDRVEQERLARLTGCYPALLRAVSSAVARTSLDLSEPEATLVERLLEREDVQSRCRKIWRALDRVKQEALKSVAVGDAVTVAPNTLIWLRDFGLVDERGGKHRLFSPIFEGFVTDGFCKS